MKVAIIGSGPAGLTAAFQLCNAGIQTHVYEADSRVGGLAKTIQLWGRRVDLGPHRFLSNDRRVNNIWKLIVGDDYEMVRRLTRILYRGQFFYYPLRPFDAFWKLGLIETASCIGTYGWAKVFPVLEEHSFEDWIVNRFGRRLFEIFFRTYSEKLWGIPCDALDSDFAAQRIKKLTLLEAIKSSFVGRTDVSHKTLAEEFAYPNGGTGIVYERMAQFVGSLGGEILCNHAVRSVIVEGGEATGIQLDHGVSHYYDHIVSTMPITVLVRRLPNLPILIRSQADALRFRSTVLVFVHVKALGLFPDNWVYIHSPELRMGRVTNFNNWGSTTPRSATTTVLAVEYWCCESDEIWKQEDASLIALASAELHKSGLVARTDISDGYVHRIKRCYPIYDRGYRIRLRLLESYLMQIQRLTVIGRYGSFKYNNQDHSILMGLLAAENIAKGTTHNLWEVNTDYDSYQESGLISKTGLSK